MLSPSQLSTYLRDNPQPLLVAVSQTSILQAALYFCLSLTKIRKGQDLDQITMENKYFKCNSVPVECQVFTCWWTCIRKSCFFWFWCWGWFVFFFLCCYCCGWREGKKKITHHYQPTETFALMLQQTSQMKPENTRQTCLQPSIYSDKSLSPWGQSYLLLITSLLSSKLDTLKVFWLYSDMFSPAINKKCFWCSPKENPPIFL